MSDVQPPPPLPKLRDDLRFVAATSDNGCTIYDPLRHRFFRVDATAAAMLQIWQVCLTAEDIALACYDMHGVTLEPRAVGAFVQWLSANELTDVVDEQTWRARALAVEKQRHGWLLWSIHNYLFIKLPLFAPQPALNALAPWLAPIFSRSFFAMVALCGCAGLYFAGREWERMLATLPELLTLQTGGLFVVSLAVVKSLHELGHAATATRFGCRVPSMGLCFMIMVPMLYTDVSDAWKLSSRRQRVLIDAAGIIVELCIACVSLLAWVLLPDGPAKSIAAMLATSSLLLSLGLNLNPLMRFDGYYILSDFIGVENLQARAFALGRWKLREWLFGLGAAAPERFSQRMTHGLIAYAWTVWLYRLVVFTGIAVLVYQMSFKLLGLVLFAVEIVFFIALPLWREGREWWRMRGTLLKTKRTLVSALVALGCVAAALVPWSTRIDIPAVLEDHQTAQLYPKRAAFVVQTGASRGARVEQGALIATLVAPDLDQDIAITSLKLKQARRRLERRPGDLEERAQTLVLDQAIAALESRLVGLEEERRELTIVAPIAGIVAELDPHLEPSRWLQRTDLVALLRGDRDRIVRGYVSEVDVARIDFDATVWFVPEQFDRPQWSARLTHISPVGSAAVDIAELASQNGGGVATRLQQRAGEPHRLSPTMGQYLVVAVPLEMRQADRDGRERVMRGVLHAQGRPESLAARTWRHVLKVLLRESGF